MDKWLGGEKRNNVYYGGFSLLLSAAILMLPGMTYAQTELQNDTTGADSVNQNSVSTSSKIQVSETNTTDVTNRTTFNFSTGGNLVRENTTVGDVTTGDIAIEYTAQTQTDNSPSILASLPSQQPQDVTATNNNTGASSSNSNQINTSKSIDITQSENSTVVNEANLVASTGKNKIERNTTVGDITTGDIVARVNFVTDINVPPAVNPTPGPGAPPTGGGAGGGGVGGGSVTPPANITPPSVSSPVVQPVGPVAMAASITPAGGVGGAEVEMPFVLTEPGRKFFPAGASQTPYLLLLALVGLWMTSPALLCRLKAAYKLIGRSESKMR